MKKIILLFTGLMAIAVFSQSPVDKISSVLKLKIEKSIQPEKYHIWIYLNDKGNDIDVYYSNPVSVVSSKSIQRRAKELSSSLSKSKILDFTDIPVNQNYIEQIQQTGFTIKQKSKWFNAVSGYATKNQIHMLTALSFVKKIDIVKAYNKRNDEIELNSSEINAIKKSQPEGIYSLNYGSSFTQLDLIKIPQVHNLGFTGQGVTICVMDAGFDNLPHKVFANMNILAAYDFVNNDFIVANENDQGEGSHGTATLSIIGGFDEGQLVGPAYGANYILAKTENTESEKHIEEDNWVAALEWADSIGVDVTSTSLGYLDGFTQPDADYLWEEMNGNTAIITIAADLAVKKGIVVVNSAGNNGDNSEHNTLGAPADGDSVIAIGAVNSSGLRVSFSSVGPTSDGRIKPDLMTMGSNVYHASSSANSYFFGGGTSYSCPLAAGVCALLLQANPNLKPMEVLQVLKSKASRSGNPDKYYGWGIIDALASINSVITSIEPEIDEVNNPDDFVLYQNYPNPFNPSTKVKYYIAQSGFIKISLYDILGNEIKTLINGETQQGLYELTIDSSELSSGIYFVNMNSVSVQKSIKISLIK